MAGGDLDAAGRDAFHAAFRVVTLVCAACALAAGAVGFVAAPKRASQSAA